MKRLFHPLIQIICLFVISLSTFYGCGSKNISLDEAKERIKNLESKGIADSAMSSIRIYLFQMEGSKKAGNTGIYRKYRDSITTALEEIELSMNSSLEASKPIVDSLLAVANKRKAPLKGLHLKAADSLIIKVDSLIKQDFILQAHVRLVNLNLTFDTLEQEQKTADELRSKFIGSWVIEKTPANKKFKAIERREVFFYKDGKLKTMESMKGRTTKYLKEDWKYISEGTWDLKGDMAIQSITKEKCLRSTFWNMNPKTNKWDKISKDPYDSTITNGSKDRYVSYDYLKENYKHFK